jgi:hypothetical protein
MLITSCTDEEQWRGVLLPSELPGPASESGPTGNTADSQHQITHKKSHSHTQAVICARWEPVSNALLI